MIRKAMRNEPTIDWLLENQDKVEHYFHKLGVEGEAVIVRRKVKRRYTSRIAS